MTIVVDLDDTLFKRSRLTRFFFKLANRIYLLGFKCEKLNKPLLRTLDGFGNVIVLSGRADDWMQKATLQQLKKHHVRSNQILLCPRRELYLDWKKTEITKLKQQYPNLVWRDNDTEP